MGKQSKTGKWLIYGANGYTGKLIARLARERGFQPVLAGRDAEALFALANELQLDYRVFDLDNYRTVAGYLHDIDAVLHCAGPFIHTAEAMARACIASGSHYLDITGEIPVYQLLYDLSDQAREAGVTLLPGVGFDIVPTDCLALYLKKQMPDAHRLEIAFQGLGAISGGTLKSTLAQLPQGSMIRENGVLRRLPHGSRQAMAGLASGKKKVFTIPWGDVFTAYHTTGIGNISVYIPLPEGLAHSFGLLQPLFQLTRFDTVRAGLDRLVDWLVSGPDEKTRQSGHCELWGRALDKSGRKMVEARARTGEAYWFTARSALLAVLRLASRGPGRDYPAGFQTPAGLFGEDFLLEIKGSEITPA